MIRECPHCHAVCDAETHIAGEPKEPQVGDLSVCVYCGTILVFTSDGFAFASADLVLKLERQYPQVGLFASTLRALHRSRN